MFVLLVAMRQKKPYDENDLHDKKHGDPDATLERDQNAAGLYGKDQRAPNGEDAADRYDRHPGEEVWAITITC